MVLAVDGDRALGCIKLTPPALSWIALTSNDFAFSTVFFHRYNDT